MAMRPVARVVYIPANRPVLVGTNNLKRHTWTIKNPSTTVTLYFGADSNISSTTGISIATGSSVSSRYEEKWLGEVWVFSTSTTTCEFIEVVDDEVIREGYKIPEGVKVPDVYAGKSLQNPSTPTKEPFGLLKFLGG